MKPCEVRISLLEGRCDLDLWPCMAAQIFDTKCETSLAQLAASGLHSLDIDLWAWVPTGAADGCPGQGTRKAIKISSSIDACAYSSVQMFRYQRGMVDSDQVWYRAFAA